LPSKGSGTSTPSRRALADMAEQPLRVAIDCDEAAVELKDAILGHLRDRGISVVDLNHAGQGSVAYPDIGFNLASKIRAGDYDRGILLCGTGLGMAIIANKVEGVYAGVCHDVYSAERLRKSNNAQVLTMGARVIGVRARAIPAEGGAHPVPGAPVVPKGGLETCRRSSMIPNGSWMRCWRASSRLSQI
jgi:ribose 5-phosphate isomerase B